MNNVKDLELQLDQAIENCDFQLAQKLKDQIKKMKQDENNDIANQYIQSFRQLTEECKNNLKEEMNSLDESISNQEILIRRKVSNIFHELQVQHIEVLLHIEKENLLKFAKEQFRMIPEVLEIKEQAKLAAYNLQYESAILMKERAEQVEEEELQRREDVVKGQFYSRRSVVLIKQKEEIRALSNKLNTALYNLQKRKEFEVEKIYQIYRKSLKDAFDNIKMFIKSIKETNLRNHCLASCLQIYKEKVSEAVPSENQPKIFLTPKSATSSRSQSQLSSSKPNDTQDQQISPDSTISPQSPSTPNQKSISSPAENSKSVKSSKLPTPNQKQTSTLSKSTKSLIPVKSNSQKSKKSSIPVKSNKASNISSPQKTKK